MQAQDIPLGLCQCGCGGRTTVATANYPRKGWIKGQPKRFISGHNGAKSPVHYLPEDHGYTSPCWIWQRSRNPQGYGVITIQRRPRLAHRWMYETHVGPIPEGLGIDHLCRVRACVNPAHLEPVTNAENARRGARAKLTWPEVDAIRADPRSGSKIAADYGVSKTTVINIKRGKRWGAT